MDCVARIEELFVLHGRQHYDGVRGEAVTALDHALQCAQLAEWAHAPSSLVAAAFLHDVGHFLVASGDEPDTDDVDECRTLALLGASFDYAVLEPVRLHVLAKRYLVSVEPAYHETLSPASIHSLDLQGGRMSPREIREFEGQRYASDAVSLRRWDDLAKQPGRHTPSLGYYLALVDEVRGAVRQATRMPRE